MKKRVLIFLCSTVNFYCCIAQIININPVPVEIGTTHFNPEAIRKNNIKRIEIKVVNKPDGSRIIDKGTTFEYKFNTKGYITDYYYTVFNKIQVVDAPPVPAKANNETSPPNIVKYINDTVFTNIMYDDLDRITCKRIKNDTVYDAYYYTYNALNQITKEVHYKETNAGNNLDSFKLGTRELVFSETFEYKILNPNQTKKISLNRRRFPYKSTFIKYDSNKNIINETNESTVSSVRQVYNYEYNSDNKLIKKSYTSNENGNLLLESIYEYDKNGNLSAEKTYKNSELFYERNYIYDGNGIFIQSEINRNYKTVTIFIAKYAYEYY